MQDEDLYTDDENSRKGTVKVKGEKIIKLEQQLRLANEAIDYVINAVYEMKHKDYNSQDEIFEDAKNLKEYVIVGFDKDFITEGLLKLMLDEIQNTFVRVSLESEVK